MQRNFLRFVRVACLALIALALLGGGIAKAEEDLDELLDGQFRSTFFRSCAQSRNGYDSENRLRSPGSTRETAILGTRIYNGDGTGTSSQSSVNIFDNEATNSFAAGTSELNCNLTYVVNPDLSFTEESACTGTVLTGSLAGETFVSGGMLQGQISPKGDILIYSDTDDNVQTITLSGAGQFLRICGLSGTAIKLAPFGDAIKLAPFGDDDDDDKDKHRHKHKDKHRHKHRGDD